MLLSNQQAKQLIDLAIASDAKDQLLNIEAEIENDEWMQLRYKGNLLGYALQVNLEKESIALIQKYPNLCDGVADFNGYCKVSGDTTDETVPLTVLALKAESNDVFQAFMGAHKLDLTLRSQQSTLIDASYTEDQSAGVVEMCDWCPTRMKRLESWAAKEGIEIPPVAKKEIDQDRLCDWNEEVGPSESAANSTQESKSVVKYESYGPF